MVYLCLRRFKQLLSIFMQRNRKMGSPEKIDICKLCPYSHSCKANNDVFKNLEKTMITPEKGNFLFKQGETFDGFYIMCQGSAKAECTTISDSPQVLEFYHPCDVIGLCGFSNGQYQETAQIMTYSRVYKVSKKDFDAALAHTPSLAQLMFELLSTSMVRRQRALSEKSQLEAEDRFLNFLKAEQDGLPKGSNGFELSMSRIDLANYLGVAVETLSRLIKNLTQKGVIEVSNRHISLCANISKSCDAA